MEFPLARSLAAVRPFPLFPAGARRRPRNGGSPLGRQRRCPGASTFGTAAPTELAGSQIPAADVEDLDDFAGAVTARAQRVAIQVLDGVPRGRARVALAANDAELRGRLETNTSFAHVIAPLQWRGRSRTRPLKSTSVHA